MLNVWKPASGVWEKHVYWGDEPPGEKYWNDLDQQALFPVNKAIIARQSNEWPAQTWKSLDSVKNISSADVWPFFCLEGNFERGQPKIPSYILKSELYLYADKMGWIWRRLPLATGALIRYVRDKVEQAGLKLSPQCMEQLCSSVLPEAASIKNEIEKLALIAQGRILTPELMGMDATTPDADTFNFMRRLLAGDISGVWKELQRGDDSQLFLLLALLARELRIYWQILAGENPHFLPGESMHKKSMANELGFSGVTDAFMFLMEAEWNVKSGRMTPIQSLEKLAIDMAALCAAKRAVN